MSEKPTLNIVLVEPRIPQNTGNVARTCACTACRLHLVGPMGFAIDDKKLKHAGLDYWHYLDISYYDGLDDFFAKNSGPYYYFTTKAPQRYTDVAYPDGAYLVFGREDAGLPEVAYLYLVESRCCCCRNMFIVGNGLVVLPASPSFSSAGNCSNGSGSCTVGALFRENPGPFGL